ncbi:hypothetical protein IQ241_08485 [Romeria aff. gracilis LEGE 07310]|uniref:PEP-CTERM sorting domain-containing protein n=1 Tax=Vasconcelosia minhoensis LEGE 07310 TaxID=915328 RepID=A0A8J7DLN2_9CYAN|nr:hypothetical protein [Romeria gracilis]MBE9077331.1 hypothetical protein [Romeria aff. gracilis LEGE 07310]
MKATQLLSACTILFKPHGWAPFCLITAASVFVKPTPPAYAQTFLEVDGRESIRFVPETVDILENLGLDLLPPISTATPAQGFDFGFQFIPPDSNTLRRSNLAFEVIEIEGALSTVPLGGIESFDASFEFIVNTERLDLDPILRFDNFSTFVPSNFFSPEFQIFIAQEDEQRFPEFRLFDVSVLGPITLDPSTQMLVLENVDLNISQEFSDFLQSAGAEVDTTGLKFIEARGDRELLEISTTEVPDLSNSLIGICLVGFGLLVSKLRS